MHVRFHSPRGLRVDFQEGFAIIEVLVSAAIATLLMGAALSLLLAGEHSLSLSTVKLECTGGTRRVLDWIVKDVRQGVAWDMASASNDPSGAHLRFKKVQGWDTTNETLVLESNSTEYTYDSGNQSIIRRLIDEGNTTLNTWQFNKITQTPFYTLDAGGSEVLLNSADLLTSRILVVRVSTQDTFRSSQTVNSTLSSEVKIRNE